MANYDASNHSQSASILDPEDLEILKKVFDELCERRRFEKGSPGATRVARDLIDLFSTWNKKRASVARDVVRRQDISTIGRSHSYQTCGNIRNRGKGSRNMGMGWHFSRNRNRGFALSVEKGRDPKVMNCASTLVFIAENSIRHQ